MTGTKPGEINWNHAEYWAEISASDLPDRAKNLLRLLFDTAKRLQTNEIKMSIAEACQELYRHLGKRVHESSVRRALANLTESNILEIRENKGHTSTWILHERQLWLQSILTPAEELRQVENRLRDLQTELIQLQKKRMRLRQEVGLPPLFNPVQPCSTLLTPHLEDDTMTQVQNRLAFDGDSQPLVTTPPTTTPTNRLSYIAANNRFNKAALAEGEHGGRGVHLDEEEVRNQSKAREIFRRFADKGLVTDDPATERNFFAFMMTVKDLECRGRIKSRAAFISSAVRDGYWSHKINATHRSKAAHLQKQFDAREQTETAGMWSSSGMPGL